ERPGGERVRHIVAPRTNVTVLLRCAVPRVYPAAVQAIADSSRERAHRPAVLLKQDSPRASTVSRQIPELMESSRRPLLQPARDGGAVDQGGQDSHPLDSSLLSPVPGERGAVAPWRYRLQPRQPAATTRLAPSHSELVADESPAAALQDGRTPPPACAVLHPATRRKLLDEGPLSADSRAHRAPRVASNVIERTTPIGASRATRAGVSLRRGRYVGTLAGLAPSTTLVRENGRCPGARTTRLAARGVTCFVRQHQREANLVHIG